MNIDLYYTLFLLLIGVGMFVYSRSLPVTLVSVYITTWFFPPLRLYGISIYPNNLLGIFEYSYLYFSYRNKSATMSLYLKRTTLEYVFRIFIVLLLVAVFSVEIGLMSQLKALMGFLFTCANIFMISLCFNQQDSFKKILTLICFLVMISGIYGIYTYFLGINPFAMLVLSAHEDLESLGLGGLMEDARGMLQGRIAAFTVHPLMFGGILALCFYMFLQGIQMVKNKAGVFVLSSFVVFIFILLFFTGSRSILIGVIVSFVYYLYSIYPKQTKFSGVFVVLIILFVGISIEDPFIRSIVFFWQDNDEVKGSSLDMRLNQFEAVIDAVSGDVVSFIFGKGVGWAGQYGEKYGCEAPFYGFEGIFLSRTVNMGIVCSLIYISFIFIPLYRYGKKMIEKYRLRRLYFAFLLCGFIIYSLTGDAYGSNLYIVLAFLLLKNSILTNNVIQVKNKNCHV